MSLSRKRKPHLTFRSLFIEEHATRESALTPYVTGGAYMVIAWLNAVTWRANSVVFAREGGFPIDYVDNCWSRVAFSGTDLRHFLQMGAAGDPAAARLLKFLGDQKWYVINEEEF